MGSVCLVPLDTLRADSRSVAHKLGIRTLGHAWCRRSKPCSQLRIGTPTTVKSDTLPNLHSHDFGSASTFSRENL
jgi:hypothetical protein